MELMISNLIKVLILISCSTMLTGCISGLIYDDATDYEGADYARVRISSGLEVHISQNPEIDGCLVPSKRKIMAHSKILPTLGDNKKIEGMPSLYNSNRPHVEFVIKANILTVIYQNPGSRWGGAYLFIPKEKHDYEIMGSDIYDLTDKKTIKSIGTDELTWCK